MQKGFLTKLKEKMLGQNVAAGDLISALTGDQSSDVIRLFEGYVHGSITAITDIASTANYFVEQVNQKTGDAQAVSNSAFMNLLQKPNEDETKEDFLEALYTDYKMYGEFFVIVERGEEYGVPLSLVHIHPNNMREVVDPVTKKLTGWQYTAGAAGAIPISKEELIHAKTYNPQRRYRGYGVLQAAVKYVLTEKYGAEFTANYLANGAMPGGVLAIKKDMSKEEFDKLVAKFREKYEGAGNAGKVLIVKNSELEWAQMGGKMSDVGLKDLKGMTSETIMAMFKVPKQEFGIPDNINLATSRELSRGFAKRVEKDMRRLCGAFQPLLDYYSGVSNTVRKNKVSYRLTFDSIVPDDIDLKLKMIESGLQYNYLTVNEAREMAPYALEKIDGGDVLREQGGVVGSAVPAKSSNGKITIKRKRFVEKLPGLQEMTLERFLAYREKKWQTIAQYGRTFDKQVAAFYDAQFNDLTKNITKDDYVFSFDTLREAKRFKDIVTPVFTDLAAAQFALASSHRDKSYDESQMSKFIATRLDLFAEQSLGGLIDRLNAVLQQSSKEGLSVDETVAALKQIYETAADAKLRMIAITEMNAVSNYAAAQGFKDIGYTYTTWFANPDACQFCGALDGKTVSVESEFVGLGDTVSGLDGGDLKNGYTGIENPPLHPNCKCDVVPSTTTSTPFEFPSFEDRPDVAALA